MLVEFHILQNHAASNLNRDDTGSVKDVVFGGIPRARISSQSLKRAIRKSEVLYEYLEKEKLGLRTKYLPEKVKEGLIEKGIAEKEAGKFIDLLMKIGGGSGDTKDEHKMTSQLIFLSEENIKTIIDYYSELKDVKEKELAVTIRNLIEEKCTVPVDVALFGRMTTNQPIKDINACCQVAHAFSVNRHTKEFDYFTAVDDLSGNFSDDPGAGHLGETEFTSACFYKYLSVDYSSLIKILKGDKDLAQNALCGLLNAVSFSNPSGKQNSFASHTLPHFIGVEIKNKKIPVNYCNAFVDPVIKGNWLEESVDKITKHAVEMRNAYSLPVVDNAVFKTTEQGNDFGENQKTIKDLEAWLKTRLA
ncbi:MAG: type I-E CRISPR-associated protein Cas7/Cse4/CasC [Spirochaetes bacterium]|nr:type I-E CRISPR-associated protein Cas7/Cse4/CasC [Spirochaetota bacterium]MBN2770111.1 type I-E CRISPR-associated protein Cas7/Cse4/CasC [Spirochaetota bacterium]